MNKKRIIPIVLIALIIFLCSICINISLKADENEKIEEYQYAGDGILEVNVVGTESDGDCILLRMNNIQIMIDALSYSEKNYTLINKKMRDYMTGDGEKKWDFIIFTHPHEDHMGNANKILHLFDGSTEWSLGNLIDYDFKEAPDDFFPTNPYSIEKGIDHTTYKKLKNELIKNNHVNYFSAAELDLNNKTKKYYLSDDLSIYILYNYADNYSDFSKRNIKSIDGFQNYISVCCLIEFKGQKLLFTGDLEEDGESELVINHKDLIEGVTFFKAGHHGSSKTSNSANFVDIIRPQYVAITKMGAAKDPDNSINHFLKYTDYIFPTYVKSENKLYSLFGDERFRFYGYKVEVLTKNNSIGSMGKAVSLFDAVVGSGKNWFREGIYGDSDLADSLYIYTFDEGLPSYSNCTLIKYGHYDILVDCGSLDYYSREFVDKLKKYVVDGVLEYVVITQNQVPNMRQMISTGDYLNGGIFDEFVVEYLIDNKCTNNIKDESKYGHYVRYLEQAKKVKKQNYRLDVKGELTRTITDHLKFSVWGSNVSFSPNENDYSMCVLIQFYNEKYLFVGDLTDYGDLLDIHKKELTNIKFLRLSNAATRIKKFDRFDEFIEYISPEKAVIGTPLHFVMSNGKEMFDKEDQETLLDINGFGDIFYCSYLNERGDYSMGNGSIIFIASKKKEIDDKMIKELSDSKPDTLFDYHKRIYGNH